MWMPLTRSPANTLKSNALGGRLGRAGHWPTLLRAKLYAPEVWLFLALNPAHPSLKSGDKPGAGRFS